MVGMELGQKRNQGQVYPHLIQEPNCTGSQPSPAMASLSLTLSLLGEEQPGLGSPRTQGYLY